MNKDDFTEWRNLPLSQEFFQFLKDYRLELMSRWANGEYSLPEMEASLLKNTEALAKCQCYQDICELDPSYIEDFYKGKSV